MMKTMMTVAAAVVLFGGLLAFPVQAQTNASAIKAAQHFFVVVKVEEQYNQMMKKNLDTEMQKKPQFAQFRPQIEAALHKGMPWSKVKVKFAQIYAKEMTADDIDKTAEFYQSPAGGKLFKKVTDGSLKLDKLQQNPMEVASQFSQEELQQIMTFMATPSGTKLVAKGQVIANNCQAYVKKEVEKCLKAAAGKVFMEAMAKNGGKVHF